MRNFTPGTSRRHASASKYGRGVLVRRSRYYSDGSGTYSLVA
jgi:hypothetical protein